MSQNIRLYGRVFIQGDIKALSGLHIGGSGAAFAIGGVDNPVIKNQIDSTPYIPGSSLKGKIRSLVEKYRGETTGQRINQIEIHKCQHQQDYTKCPICNVFGITAEDYNLPTRLIVRDVPLSQGSIQDLERARTDQPFTEIKTEASIDRVTSAAVPRDLERVPAGSIFQWMEMVYNIYTEKDVEWLEVLLDGMSLLEDDYLGGSGTRGNGKIAFENLNVTLKSTGNYRNPDEMGVATNLNELSGGLEDIKARVRQLMFGE